MASVIEEDARRALNPLFNDNRIRLATFGTNVSHGCAITTIDGTFETTWPNTKKLARMVDDAGFEAIVPVARWKGFGGETNFNGSSFETYTWAAGLAASTDRVAVMSTSHVPTIHPIVAAKQATTIDHISNGRFALNIVCGWFAPELEMFGAPIMEHDLRYEYAEEWLEILKLLWTREDEFDYEGRFFKIAKGFHEPKPIQRPFPALMNAGGSERGWRFAAKTCDMAFTGVNEDDLDVTRARLAHMHEIARSDYGRDIQIWAACFSVIGDTDEDARAFHHHYVHDKGDWEAATNLTNVMGMYGSPLWTPEKLHARRAGFISGWNGHPLVGTAETIVDQILEVADIGFDGIVFSCPRYEEDLARWIEEVIPLMEQAGLRQPPPASGSQ